MHTRTAVVLALVRSYYYCYFGITLLQRTANNTCIIAFVSLYSYSSTAAVGETRLHDSAVKFSLGAAPIKCETLFAIITRAFALSSICVYVGLVWPCTPSIGQRASVVCMTSIEVTARV